TRKAVASLVRPERRLDAPPVSRTQALGYGSNSKRGPASLRNHSVTLTRHGGNLPRHVGRLLRRWSSKLRPLRCCKSSQVRRGSWSQCSKPCWPTRQSFARPSSAISFSIKKVVCISPRDIMCRQLISKHVDDAVRSLVSLVVI